MLPILAIVGRPNVGKSTLFNRLTRTRDALVGEKPGLTRDRQYGIAQIKSNDEELTEEKNIIIVDTGGMGEEEELLSKAIVKQALAAMQEATAILFVVDARSGLTTVDQNIIAKIRKLNKPIFLAVNKIDGLNEKVALAPFYELGFANIYAISAEHGTNVSLMLEKIYQSFPEDLKTCAEQIDAENTAIRIAFVGRPNVGKSTLVNRILGEERVIVYDQPGTTRDSIFVNFSRHNKKYILIDTAGIRRRGRVNEGYEKFSVIKALQAIESANVVVMVLDARGNVADQDLRLLGLVLDAGKALVLAVNKWDGITQLQKDTIRSELERKLRFVDFAKIYFISALHGTGVGNIFTAIDRAYKSATQEIKTSEITRLLASAVSNYHPPLVRGKSVKLRYAHVGGRNPPLILIYGTRVESIPESYRKYLEHYFREKLKLVGTPIRIVFKSKLTTSDSIA